ncbi:DUF1156 domain-containing protein [Streptomyces sp. B15]|uniref:DUF1156 domain-containing protein n=1 Tax=Streptomyces sp. B15 TaxID=1537797 RepID=UPI001B377758|nr:DUF1156 domain-containing protein [Streptomyces sp. B15]MBQ1122216.1 DUF1156 domain-containing protein [Streptomyces sp. B15]
MSGTSAENGPMGAGSADETVPRKRKLIEVALPLDAINKESAREKSIRHGHPSTLHLWWARRPLAAARAVLFAQLVDDPSARPDLFPTEEDQDLERKRLFHLIERMVPWEATRDERLMREVREKIAESCGGTPPPVLDPFAGGGTIPLEAQRLGLEAHASDLNPVPVLINKALIEIPPKWAGRAPVAPDAEIRGDWSGTSGLAEDVRRYGGWMREEALQRIGGHYPKATLPDGTKAQVIAWLWARTVTCPSPACGAQMPLVTTWWLSKKKERPRWLEPKVEGKQVSFKVCDGKDGAKGPSDPPKQGRGAKFTCLVCRATTSDAYIKEEGTAGRLGATLLATVAEGKRQRVYVEATAEHVRAAQVERPENVLEERLPKNARWFSPPLFGLETYQSLFTPRQLLAMTTFSDLVSEARAKVAEDAVAAGMTAQDASEYGEAVATYLGLAFSRTADLNNAIVTWSNGRDQARNLFSRQAIPMAWDFVEVSPFACAAGDVLVSVATVGRVVESLSALEGGSAQQGDASKRHYCGAVVSTDPPYYDNIGYSDLSDFFYVWLRRSLGGIYPDVMPTILTPKQPELIASPYRHGGSKEKAEQHFERGFVETFTRIREGHLPDFPLTVFYAFKQSETDDVDGTASTGWETMLNGLMEAGLSVTATWPVRTERAGRSIGIGTNALASSIVLACRSRPATAATTDRRGFRTSLRQELPAALRELQQGNVAPVDMAQSAIGPGIAIYSRYAKVTEADGTSMRVRTALAMINEVLAEVLSEQEGDFDMDTRWCIKWFEQFQWERGTFGDAETLSKAYNTSVRGMEDAGVIGTGDSKVCLLRPRDLPTAYDPAGDGRISTWEVAMHLSRVLEGKGPDAGIDAAGELLARVRSREEVDDDSVKELAYLLYSICERNGWSESAQWFNNLVSSWPDLQTSARAAERTVRAEEERLF